MQIEKTVGVNIYYAKEWLGNELVSGTYQNAPLSEILRDIFKNTVINFYILDNDSIVLTQNTIIKDELHQSFYQDSLNASSSANKVSEAPSFFYLEEKQTKTSNIETVRIGRERKNSQQEKFILSGTVKNSTTGDPIQNLAVVVKGGSVGTSTNAQGFYQIELPAGVSILQTKAIGIESVEKRVVIYNNGQLDFNL
ncbi:MAG: carboxypeptidase-like regulatory domain-containing protein, partial [Aurantibacter sp.]